jgi:hypothetical protein
MFPKWQPISSAPKDGTRILVFEADEDTGETVRVSRWRNDTIPAGWAGGERPSHWLPLPLPPNAPKRAANGNAVAASMEG